MALAEGTTRESSLGQERRRARLEGKDRDVPEGGWGWFIVVAVAMSKVVSYGILPLFAIIFKSVITSDPTYEGSAVTFLVGLFFQIAELSGVFFPALNRKFSLRTTSFLGGVIFTVGGIASIFVITVPQLAVTYSILQGTGYGLMLSSSVNAFNQFFRERATTAMATAQFATSVLSLGLPHGVQAALDAGGECAARALVVALAVGTAAAQLLVRGLPRPSADAQQPLKESEEINAVDDKLPQRSTCSLKETFKRRIRHCALGLWHHLGFSQRPLRAVAVWGPAVGLALVHTGDTNFFALLPLHLRKVGFDKSEVTQAITAANIGDAVGRLALIVLGLWLRRVNRHIFALSSIGTAICVLGISWLLSWEAILSFSGLLGMFRGMLFVTILLVIMENVQASLFTSALALFFFFVFVSSLTMSPLIGLVRDVSGSYPASFCLVAALCALFPVAWPAHALWRRFTREQRERKGSPISQRPEAYQQVSDANV